ncbi:DUF485 domain-containing protein [Streptomyces griseus]|uniref:DUF485 domain-containing protein n=1 Tax=Streptomyces griseus TaxID=1911 RepID=UPI0005697E95|nr:DUF485 domain-containing protein [Streptomyces griseus]
MPEFSPWPDDSSAFHAPQSRPISPQQISHDPEFRSLRRARLRFATRATALSVGAFLLYVLLSSFAPGVMNEPLIGHFTLGLALGLGQFVVMAVTAWRYATYMRTKVDPLADHFRSQLRHEPLRPRPAAQAQTPAPAQAQGTRGFPTW